MTIDYARLAIGLAPLGIAIGVIAILHLRSKPTVVTSGQEVLLLGFAVSGFAMIGPMELFFPTSSYAALGEWVWVLLAALYFFFVLLASLLSRSSLTVVGLSPDRLQESLVTALATEDIEEIGWASNLIFPIWECGESSKGVMVFLALPIFGQAVAVRTHWGGID